jgi:hypothetical protein
MYALDPSKFSCHLLCFYVVNYHCFIAGPPENPNLENSNVEEDPLPSNEEHNDEHQHNDLVTINVTNELGQTKAHLSNG